MKKTLFAVLFCFVTLPAFGGVTQLMMNVGSAAAATATPSPTPSPTATPVPAPALVQQKVCVGSTTSVTCTFDTPITAGNSLKVAASVIPALSGRVNSVDTAPNADNSLGPVFSPAQSVTGVRTNIYYVDNALSSGPETGVTVVQLNATEMVVSISEWSGLTPDSITPDGATGTLDSNPSAPPVNPSSSNNVVFAVAAWTADDYSTGPSGGFTRMTPVGGALLFQETAYIIRNGDGSATGTNWTLSSGINWATVIVAHDAP